MWPSPTARERHCRAAQNPSRSGTSLQDSLSNVPNVSKIYNVPMSLSCGRNSVETNATASLSARVKAKKVNTRGSPIALENSSQERMGRVQVQTAIQLLRGILPVKSSPLKRTRNSSQSHGDVEAPLGGGGGGRVQDASYTWRRQVLDRSSSVGLGCRPIHVRGCRPIVAEGCRPTNRWYLTPT